jgi:uncharacterized paraquat-inducible protein A
MPLVRCKECRTLNSDQAEICLSCEYPIKGRASTHWWKRLAILLAILIGLPVALAVLEQLWPSPPGSSPQVPTEGPLS